MVKAYSLGSIATIRTNARRSHRPVYLKICNRCEKEYTTKNKMSNHCSGPCAMKARPLQLSGSNMYS